MLAKIRPVLKRKLYPDAGGEESRGMRLWSALSGRARQMMQRRARQLPNLRLKGGNLVLPSGVVQADLLIQDRHIVAIQHNRATPCEEHVVDVSGLLVVPGLINAHDHLEFNCFPRLGERGAYTNSYEWGLDITRRRRLPVVDQVLEIPLRDRLLVGAYKNLLAGVSTVCHHGRYWRIFSREFPVEVVRDYGWCHSLGFGDDVGGSYRRTSPDAPWIIHLAEGIDERAHGELGQLAQLGCLGANTLVVHGVGVSQADIDLLARSGAGLIWCPASNLFMFGQTAPIARLLASSSSAVGDKPRNLGGLLALGSDSRVSGSRDLLAELKVARSLNLATDEELFYMVTRDAARLLRIDHQVGTIEPGKRANLLILEGEAAAPYQAVVTAARTTIRLLLIAGRPVYGTPGFGELFQAAGHPFTRALVEGRPYLMSGDAVDVERGLRRLEGDTTCAVRDPVRPGERMAD
jgi:cytosine/adenosine deaminase-related metal-dependent hydrolase